MPRAPSENWTGSGCQTGEPEEVADGHDQIAVFWIAAGVGQPHALARIPAPDLLEVGLRMVKELPDNRLADDAAAELT
jgi:hypothetical protein